MHYNNFSTIHLQLNYIDVLEVAILLVTCQTKYEFKTEDVNLIVLNMITRINESKANQIMRT